MFNYIRKLVFPILISIMFVFLPFTDAVPTILYPCVKDGIKVEQQVDSFVSYSVCNAATNNNKYAKSKKAKTAKREASFLSKAAGFVIGCAVCKFLMALAGLISFGIFHNSFNMETDEGPWVRHGLLTGLLYFIGRCIVTGLIISIFTVTANMMGFIQWFDYACYAIMLYLFLEGKHKGSYCLAIIGGYILGIILMEKFFG